MDKGKQVDPRERGGPRDLDATSNLSTTSSASETLTSFHSNTLSSANTRSSDEVVERRSLISGLSSPSLLNAAAPRPPSSPPSFAKFQWSHAPQASSNPGTSPESAAFKRFMMGHGLTPSFDSSQPSPTPQPQQPLQVETPETSQQKDLGYEKGSFKRFFQEFINPSQPQASNNPPPETPSVIVPSTSISTSTSVSTSPSHLIPPSTSTPSSLPSFLAGLKQPVPTIAQAALTDLPLRAFESSAAPSENAPSPETAPVESVPLQNRPEPLYALYLDVAEAQAAWGEVAELKERGALLSATAPQVGVQSAQERVSTTTPHSPEPSISDPMISLPQPQDSVSKDLPIVKKEEEEEAGPIIGISYPYEAVKKEEPQMQDNIGVKVEPPELQMPTLLHVEVSRRSKTPSMQAPPSLQPNRDVGTPSSPVSGGLWRQYLPQIQFSPPRSFPPQRPHSARDASIPPPTPSSRPRALSEAPPPEELASGSVSITKQLSPPVATILSPKRARSPSPTANDDGIDEIDELDDLYAHDESQVQTGKGEPPRKRPRIHIPDQGMTLESIHSSIIDALDNEANQQSPTLQFITQGSASSPDKVDSGPASLDPVLPGSPIRAVSPTLSAPLIPSAPATPIFRSASKGSFQNSLPFSAYPASLPSSKPVASTANSPSTTTAIPVLTHPLPPKPPPVSPPAATPRKRSLAQLENDFAESQEGRAMKRAKANEVIARPKAASIKAVPQQEPPASPQAIVDPGGAQGGAETLQASSRQLTPHIETPQDHHQTSGEAPPTENQTSADPTVLLAWQTFRKNSVQNSSLGGSTEDHNMVAAVSSESPQLLSPTRQDSLDDRRHPPTSNESTSSPRMHGTNGVGLRQSDENRVRGGALQYRRPQSPMVSPPRPPRNSGSGWSPPRNQHYSPPRRASDSYGRPPHRSKGSQSPPYRPWSDSNRASSPDRGSGYYSRGRVVQGSNSDQWQGRGRGMYRHNGASAQDQSAHPPSPRQGARSGSPAYQKASRGEFEPPLENVSREERIDSRRSPPRRYSPPRSNARDYPQRSEYDRGWTDKWGGGRGRGIEHYNSQDYSRGDSKASIGDFRRSPDMTPPRRWLEDDRQRTPKNDSRGRSPNRAHSPVRHTYRSPTPPQDPSGSTGSRLFNDGKAYGEPRKSSPSLLERRSSYRPSRFQSPQGTPPRPERDPGTPRDSSLSHEGTPPLTPALNQSGGDGHALSLPSLSRQASEQAVERYERHSPRTPSLPRTPPIPSTLSHSRQDHLDHDGTIRDDRILPSEPISHTLTKRSTPQLNDEPIPKPHRIKLDRTARTRSTNTNPSQPETQPSLDPERRPVKLARIHAPKPNESSASVPNRPSLVSRMDTSAPSQLSSRIEGRSPRRALEEIEGTSAATSSKSLLERLGGEPFTNTTASDERKNPLQSLQDRIPPQAPLLSRLEPASLHGRGRGQSQIRGQGRGRGAAEPHHKA